MGRKPRPVHIIMLPPVGAPDPALAYLVIEFLRPQLRASARPSAQSPMPRRRPGPSGKRS